MVPAPRVIARTIGAACLAAWMSSSSPADELRLVLDPGATAIRFQLPATLHTVQGSAKLDRGTIVFNPLTGGASGEIVVDASSLETGNRRRDRVMHEKVLESATFPTIVLVPERLEGSLAKSGASRIRLHGELRIHGTASPVVVSAEVQTGEEVLAATARLSVPYVALGMEDPSKLVLRVGKEVGVEIRLTARRPVPSPTPAAARRRVDAPRPAPRPTAGPGW